MPPGHGWLAGMQGDGDMPDAGGAVTALAAALPALTNLQAVSLERDTSEDGVSPHPDFLAGWPSLLAAINSLPRLHPEARAECERFDRDLEVDQTCYG